MKKLYLLALALITGITISYGQTVKTFGAVPKRACHFDQHLNKTLKDNPEAQSIFDQQENAILEYTKTIGQQRIGEEIIIPVYVRILHGGTTQPENISDNQVLSQINALNTYFEPYDIKFCLSRLDHAGNLYPGTTPGIVRQQSPTLTSLDVNTELNNLISFMPGNQLNIYIVKDITDNGQSGTVVGLGSMPGISSGFDGIVMRYDAFGDINDPLCTTCTLDPSSNQGKILVHEVGHYLGLFHTFMGGCQELYSGTCQTMGDRICDTPPVAQQNNGCPVGANSCHESPDLPDAIDNYMDYTDESCLNGFSQGQKARMIAILNMYRAQLISIENLSARGISCVNPLLLTSFTAINYSPCVGTPLTFTAGNATGATYAWNFGDPASGTANTSTQQAPSHSFSSAGIYTVTLTITIGTESVGVSKQVYPVNCTPINNVNTNWFFSTLSAFSFQTGIPVQSTITTTGYANSFHEACAVQSNDAGQLLFYTNGVRVFNSSQTSVNNSNLLLGNTSSNDGALIVPDPSGPNKYYIFTKAAEGGMDGFRHTKVEMVGSTPVLSNVNTPVTFPAGYMIGNNGAIRGTEGISAIQKCDGWWIITGLRKTETQHFTVVYSLDSTGLHYVSEIQTESGSLYQNGYRISPDGNYVMAGTLASATVMDFDKNTGILSNLRSTNINGLTNACFSPNSKYLYIAYPNFGKLYQYDLTNPSLNAGREEMAIPFANTGQMQMGPDNKLYLLMYNNSKLAVIHYPNNKATIDEPNAYHFTHEGPTAQSPGLLGLPNVIHARLATVYTNTISANALSCLQYRFVANACATNYSWNFGDSASGAGNTSALAAPTHTFSGPGTYTVTVIADGAQIQLQVTVGGTTPVISGSTTACVETGNQTSHSAPLEASSTVQWSIVSGSGSFSGPSSYPDVTVSWTSLPGTIRLTVTDATGCVNSADQIVTSDCQTGECPGDLVFSIPQPINTVTYNVSNSITGENDYTIESGTTVELLAGKVVLLKPNAWVKAGSVFLAAIVPCPEARSLLNTEDISAQQLVAYPNPTKGVLQLSGKPIAEVTIFDIIGKKVYQSGYDDINQVTIDMSNFLKGLYLVRVVTDTGEVESIKIIKE